MTEVTLKVDNKGDDLNYKYSFKSLIEQDGIYESRAQDLANILVYDKETYSDINIETIIRAATIAGILEKF